jgi:hypothetical protein
LILQNNLYGLDIDDRASQLAYFALMIKARSYNRRFFRQENIPQPMLYAIPETKIYIIGLEKWLGASMTESDRKASFEDLKYIGELFAKGKELGSLIKIKRDIDFIRLRTYVRDYARGQMTIEEAEFIQQTESLDRLIDVAEMLSQKCDIVVTNPPYMAPAPSQLDWIKKNYPDSKADLCVVFIERNFGLLKQSGYLSMITMHSWMFLASFERYREKYITSKDIINMVHLGARAFEEISGEVVQTTAFVMRCSHIKDYIAVYARLTDYNSQQAKENAFLSVKSRHYAKKENLEKIPSMPVAYWVSDKLLFAFTSGELIEKVAPPKQGSTLGNNDQFLRLWYEVATNNEKWFPCLKGGTYRKWYGNHDFLVNWQNDGAIIKQTGKQTIRNPQFLFKKGISWSRITSSPSFRIMHDGFFFESASGVCFPVKEDLIILGLLNSKVVYFIGKALNPTLTLQSGDLSRIPVLMGDDKEVTKSLVEQNIDLSRTDWDSFETSWDFQTHPLI